MPQLLDNATRSLLHAEFPYSSTWEPYHSSSVDLADTIASSACREVGLATRIDSEYPIWSDLQKDGWIGTIEDINVANASRVLERRGFRACAVVNQVQSDCVAPDDGRVHLQFQRLALAVDISRARTIRPHVRNFSSEVPGIQILPGGGWSLGGSDGPVVMDAGSLYVFSTRACTVRIEVRGGNAEAGVSLALRDPALDTIRPTYGAGAIDNNVHILGGISRLRLTVTSTTAPADHRAFSVGDLGVVACG
jgi:hypothetical protein